MRRAGNDVFRAAQGHHAAHDLRQGPGDWQPLRARHEGAGSPKKTSCSFMSRTERLPVSGSLSKIVSRMVTLSGAEYVIPRSSHSDTSYLSCSPTGSPHLLQKSGVLALYVPHLVQSTSPMWKGSVLTVEPQLRQV